MISPLSVCQCVNRSVSKRVFSKTAPMIFVKLLRKLGCLKSKKPDFWEKLHFVNNAQKYPQNSFFLRWCRVRDLFGSQIPVVTEGFELRIPCIRSSYLTQICLILQKNQSFMCRFFGFNHAP